MTWVLKDNYLTRTILLRPSKCWGNKFPGLVIAWLDNPFLEELSNFQINRYGLKALVASTVLTASAVYQIQFFGQ